MLYYYELGTKITRNNNYIYNFINSKLVFNDVSKYNIKYETFRQLHTWYFGRQDQNFDLRVKDNASRVRIYVLKYHDDNDDI